METKVCSGCKKKLSVDNFRLDKRYSDGRYCHCKFCVSKTQKKSYQKRKKHYIKKAKEYQQKYPDKSKVYQKRANNKLRRDNELYDKFYIKQNGCCAICGKHQSSLDYSLCFDHNHLTGNERGLLCRVCNLGIANLKTDECGIELLKMAIKYIEKTDGNRTI